MCENIIKLRSDIYNDAVGMRKYICKITDYTHIFTLLYTYLLMGKQQTNFKIFMIGYVTNIIINYILKTLLRCKRPIINKFLFQKMEKHNIRHINYYDIYGMPNTSTQLLGYILSYVLYVTHKVTNIIIVILQIAIVIYKGIICKEATVIQIIAGLLIGNGIGLYFGKYREKQEVKEVKEKQDDKCKIKE